MIIFTFPSSPHAVGLSVLELLATLPRALRFFRVYSSLEYKLNLTHHPTQPLSPGGARTAFPLQAGWVKMVDRVIIHAKNFLHAMTRLSSS